MAAASADDRQQAALDVLQAYMALRHMCRSRHAACGEHVAPAVFHAAQVLGTGKVARGISVGRILLQDAEHLPGAKQLAPALMLWLGDQCFEIGILEWAQEHYRDHVRLGGPQAESAATIVLAIAVVLGNADAVGTDALLRHFDEGSRQSWSRLLQPNEGDAAPREGPVCAPVLSCDLLGGASQRGVVPGREAVTKGRDHEPLRSMHELTGAHLPPSQ